jgi:hypothetical protein
MATKGRKDHKRGQGDQDSSNLIPAFVCFVFFGG